MIKIHASLNTELVEYLNKVGYFDGKSIDEAMTEIAIIKAFEEADGWGKDSIKLTEELGQGIDFWDKFLNNQYVKMWSLKKIKEFADIQQRIGIANTARMASHGDPNALKSLMGFTGLLDKYETQTVVVLHHVSRPEIEENLEEEE